MNAHRVLSASIVVLCAAASVRAADVVVPNGNLKADNIPPIPAALAAKVAPYTEFKPTTAASWHPVERELIVARRAGNVIQLHRVAKAGDEPRQITDFAEPVRFGMYLPKAPDTLVFSRDSGGNEQRQLYRV
ncbi:MAG TPA: S9 family peptidase, partial [Casimicrobiaceae bacterium]|nr:S9 family peptidase [Casimicrobiaceae bacterium]